MDHSANLHSSRVRPRILFANATADVGGAEQVILSLADRLPGLGFEVSYALLRPGPLVPILQKRGLDVHVFPEDFRFRNLRSVHQCTQWLTQCIRSTGANLLHSNLTAHFIGGWSSRRARIPELWHLHDYPFRFDPVHAMSRLLPANYYVFTTDFIRSGEPILARRPHAVIKPNCIDIEVLRSMQTKPDVWASLKVKPKSYFLTVARLQEHKGHAYLIEAAALLKRLHPEIKFIIAGRTKGVEQESYLARLREQTAKAELNDHIVFAGFVPDEEMPSLFRGAIGLVHPAVTEGYGLVLLEAMAHHSPVIAAAAAGPAEIIQNHHNGILVPVKDSYAIYEAMLSLVRDSHLAERLGDQGAIDVSSMSVQTMAEQFAEIYQRMLGHL